MGRWLCKFPLLQIWSGRDLLALSSLRVVFVPLFLACNIQPGISYHPLLDSDLAFFVILFFFGVTNGQLGRYTLNSLQLSSPCGFVDGYFQPLHNVRPIVGA